MSERNYLGRSYLGMLRTLGKSLHELLEAFLARTALSVFDRDVPVLRASLDEGHGYAEAVHLVCELSVAEEHLLGHILMAIEHGFYLALPAGQTNVSPHALGKGLVLGIVRSIERSVEIKFGTMALQLDALTNVVGDSAHGVDVGVCAVETCAEGAHCERLGIEHLVIPLDFMTKYFKSSLLEGAEAIPEGHYADENMRSTVVPFRNGIMLSVAVGSAESRGLRFVMMANHGGDHTIYPDCTPQFVDAFDEAARAGTFVNVGLLSPFVHLTKGDIARRGRELGINYAETWSCYKGGDRHCGRCGTCVERREALAAAGIPDPTEYEE